MSTQCKSIIITSLTCILLHSTVKSYVACRPNIVIVKHDFQSIELGKAEYLTTDKVLSVEKSFRCYTIIIDPVSKLTYHL